MTIYHDVRLPDSISNGAEFRYLRQTEITTLANKREFRSTPQKDSVRLMNIAFGVRRQSDIDQIVALWEIVFSQLIAFRVQFPPDHKSCGVLNTPNMTDQVIGAGDAVADTFQVTKTLTMGARSYTRDVKALVPGSLLVAVDGVLQAAGVDYTADDNTGIITFIAPPAAALEITAGYEFDIIVRFTTPDLASIIDSWSNDNGWDDYGSVPEIGLIEVDK